MSRTKHLLVIGILVVALAVVILVLSGVIPQITAFILASLLVYRYSMLFGVIFISAIIVPIPANTVLLAIGSFVAQGYFDFAKVVMVSLVANVLGDTVGYFITYLFGHPVARKLRFREHTFFNRLKRYVKSHPISTVFLTRFVTSLGSIVNFMAGLAPIPFSTFIVYDVIGNLINLLFFLYVGVLVGNYWERFSDIFSWAGGILGAGIVLVVLIKVFKKVE